LKVIGGSPGEAVRTTIDLRTQTAAEQAPTGVTQAIVGPTCRPARSVRSSPLYRRRVRPRADAPTRRADLQEVTTAAASHGTTPSTPTTCPPTFTVDGRVPNFEGEAEPS
jgi:hypothetical protein